MTNANRKPRLVAIVPASAIELFDRASAAFYAGGRFAIRGTLAWESRERVRRDAGRSLLSFGSIPTFGDEPAIVRPIGDAARLPLPTRRKELLKLAALRTGVTEQEYEAHHYDCARS